MSEELVEIAAVRMSWPRRIALVLLGLVALFGLALWIADTSIGHRYVTDRIAGLRPSNGLRYSVGRIEGSLYSDATLIDVRVYDTQGLVFTAPRAELGWSPFAWLSNKLDIRRLVVPAATLSRIPKTRPSGKQGAILPGFDIRIGELRVDRLTLGAAVSGRIRYAALKGQADLHSGRALIDLAAIAQGTDRIRVKLDAEPDKGRFDLDAHARGAADGVLAHMIGRRWPISLDVSGKGDWQAWNGRALAMAGDNRVIDLAITNKAGAYRLTGAIDPGSISDGKLQRLTSPRIAVDGTATLADRRLDGLLKLKSDALAIETQGEIDLADSSYRNLRISADLLRPQALFPNMSGRAIQLRAILDGAFATAAFDYRLTASRFAFDETGFEVARASGRGHLSKSPINLPITFTAQRVTGVGDVAGGILRNLSVSGLLRVTSTLITGDALKLSSDRLAGSINLMLDLQTGEYDVGLNGRLGRYLVPGIGLVDVTSKLQVVPGPGGKGTRVVGVGTAQVLRLDNSFFHTLAGGLPKIVTGLERTPDGVLHLKNLVLTAPKIRITGNGYRRRDGTFHFEGSGRQATYGAFRIVLDGNISRPTLDLIFAAPNEAAGLKNVRVHLQPEGDGFAFKASGGSLLGDFTGNGAIHLPSGGTSSIEIAALEVSGAKASGTLRIVDGGFDGQLALTGGGISGQLTFQPVGGIQRIAATLDARDGRIGPLRMRRGHLEAVALLDPAGLSVEATMTASGLRANGFNLARFAGTLKMRGGTGELRASFAGSRGRAFDIQTVTQIAPGRFSIVAQGTIDRRAVKLDTPAVFTKDGSVWALAPVQLTFAGGRAQVSGRFGGGETGVEASLASMPLSILDIGFPGLGLGGSASGHLTYAQKGDGAPTGKMDMTVRGLTRSGLVLSSKPIDVGVAAVLEPNKLAMRAVAQSEGKEIGRAQALLSPLGSGGFAERIKRANLFGQLRYSGPADTLWRLTGIELFDLSGPVAIAADVSGTLADPQIKGAVQARGARIESAATGTVLSNVQASGRFGGSKLVIDILTADAGRGKVTGAGQFDFAAANGVGMSLRLQADNAVAINRDDIGATVSGPLSITSDGNGGTIGGDLRVSASRFRLGQAAGVAAVPKLNVREINLPFGREEDDKPAAPWGLNIKAHIPDNLRVTGLGLDSEWGGDLQIGDTPEAPAIAGRVDLIRGTYEFASRDFQLERGIIRFDGSVPSNPALDISANADTSDVSATIRVTGTSGKPEISFSSVPALPQEELLSRLLFGTSITNLSAPEALQLASAVAALNNTGSGLDPINAVRRATGLDRLRIISADPTTGQGTSIAAGKYITRRLFAQIITDGQGYSATQLEFQITRWLSILSSISTIGRTSINARVSKDY